MDLAIVSALSAVLGSAVGGSASLATAWITQKTQSRRELLSAEIRKREALYGEFISECSKLAIDSLDHSLDQPDKLFQVYAIQNRIRLLSSDAVVSATDDTMQRIIAQYFQPNLTPDQVRDLALSLESEHVGKLDPLKAFSEACRNELKSLYSVT